MKTSDFDYNLSKELIANKPASPRDHSRLLVLDRKKKTISHHFFYDLPQFLKKGDVLVFNETAVIKARLKGKIRDKMVEILLLRKKDGLWQAMVKPGRKFVLGAKIVLAKLVEAEVKKIDEDGTRFLKFNISDEDLDKFLAKNGLVPIPPYIDNAKVKLKEYQTVYAKNKGSVAAPTAGFHFTKKLLSLLKKKGVQFEFVTLHIGRGTFQPVKAENILDHKMHFEYFNLAKEAADRLNKAKKEGRRIIAVGTTSVRTLESCARRDVAMQRLYAKSGETNLFIYPGYKWKFVDAMITNFHLPKSTLLMLISSLASREFILKAYQEAINKKYRFYSFGDSMLIV